MIPSGRVLDLGYCHSALDLFDGRVSRGEAGEGGLRCLVAHIPKMYINFCSVLDRKTAYARGCLIHRALLSFYVDTMDMLCPCEE